MTKSGLSAARLQRIEPAMERFVSSGVISGCNTLVSRRGEIVHQASLGLRDREHDLAMQPDTIFRIYSMTKPIVCTGLMLLWEEGAFHLDDPVATHLPEFASTQVMSSGGTLEPQILPMTIRQLLTHTSGLTYEFEQESPTAARYREQRIMNDATRTLEEVVSAIAEIPLESQPGTRFRYSVGIDVAARLIEVLSGQSLSAFLSERLFRPLAMVDTGFEVDAEHRHRVAAMYGLPDLISPDYSIADLITATLGEVNERQDVSNTYPVDGGPAFARGGLGLFSTIGDYHQFAQMLLSGKSVDGERVIGRKTLEIMHANHLPAALLPWQLLGQPNHGLGFGLGSRVMMDPAIYGEPGSPGEFGWAGAAKTYYWVDPAEEMVGVFMAQYMTGPVRMDHTFRILAYQAIDD